MIRPVAARRLEVHAAARGDLAGFLRLDPQRLRFSLGTSLAEVSVPIEVSSDAASIVRGSGVELALLLTSHHRRFVAGDDLDRLILREDYAALPVVQAALSPSTGGPDLRSAVQLGPALHPALTGGVVSAWMGKGGRGRSLVALWIELLRQAFVEMGETRGRERTPLLVVLALSQASAASAADMQGALPSAPLDRYFRAGALAGMWLAARTGLFRAWRETGREAKDPLALQLEAAISPVTFLGGRAGALAGGVTLYGLELSAGVPRADDLLVRLSAGGGAEEAASEILSSLKAEHDLGRRAEAAVALAALRDLLSDGLSAAEGGGPRSALDSVRDLLCGPGALSAAFADEAGRRELQGVLSELSPKGKEEPLGRAAAAVRSWRQKDPGAALGISRASAHAEYAAAASSLLADVTLDRVAGVARRAFSFRTGREAEGGSEAQWELGRLYRLSARGGRILRAPSDRRTAHLFTDVKDFTRRTALLGEAAMAEFLRREFYGPILTAAQEHFSGMDHLADRGGVSLNALLGDAISFCGRIDAMVDLAKMVRGHMASYALRLAREVSSEVVARQIAVIEQAQAAALSEARAARERAEALLTAERAGTEGHAVAQATLARARTEEERLSAERERALSRARGEALEAGTFISYGSEPLVVVIEDEVFGRNRVAIAEKINEAARGTARAPSARSRADAALKRERARRGNPELPHAFSVFIGRPFGLALGPEAEEEAVSAWREGDGARAMRLLSGPAREALRAASQDDPDEPADIYNSGAALSEEALEVFLAEVGRARDVRRLTVPPERIPEELKARWFFGEGPQDLVVCGRGNRVEEMFRRVGRASFKGLGGVVVWELCAETGGPGALAAALGTSWFKGAL